MQEIGILRGNVFFLFQSGGIGMESAGSVLAAGRSGVSGIEVGSFGGGGLDGPLLVGIGTDSARGDEDETAEDEDDADRQDDGTGDVCAKTETLSHRCETFSLFVGERQRRHHRPQHCHHGTEHEEAHGREGVIEGFVLVVEQGPSGRTALYISAPLHHLRSSNRLSSASVSNIQSRYLANININHSHQIRPRQTQQHKESNSKFVSFFSFLSLHTVINSELLVSFSFFFFSSSGLL